MPLSPAQERDIQGFSLAGFRKDHQQLIFLQFAGDPAATHGLLAGLQRLVSSHLEVASFNQAFSEIRQRTGREDVIEACWIALMISARGYGKLGVNLAELPAGAGTEAFMAGMAARAAQVGHTRPNDAPAGWLAAFRPDEGVDACIVVAADDVDDLDARVVEIENLIGVSNCEIVYQEAGAVLPGEMRGHEHFGFKDGVSQPSVAGVDPEPAAGDPPSIAIGEFVLGYPDQAASTPPVGSLWQDGSFVVFERIRQDVAAFRQQAAVAAEGTAPALSAAQMEAKMVGRWPSGTPLQTAPEADPGATGVTNAFSYQADADGSVTPRFAHIRKANPRDETRPDPGDPVERHRMIRRGSPFGAPLSDGEGGDPGAQRGLHFLCCVADVARQFEFVQSRWLNDPNFPNGGAPEQPGGQYQPPAPGTPADGPDPVVGEHDPGAQDAMHQGAGVHQFALATEVVSVTAGEYFFAPSLQALSQLASGATASS
jgi:Dyp-type peroxidase family